MIGLYCEMNVIDMYMVAMNVLCCGFVFVMRCLLWCVIGALSCWGRSPSDAVLAIKRDWLVLAWLHSPVINREVDAYE